MSLTSKRSSLIIMLITIILSVLLSSCASHAQASEIEKKPIELRVQENEVVILKQSIATSSLTLQSEPSVLESESYNEEDVEEDVEYDYSVPVAESESVDDSYFDHAVFIGDSRTDGLRLWGGQSNMRALYGVGLNIKTIFTAEVANDETETIMAALQDMEYDYLYISLGINELGWDDTSTFKEDYRTVIKALKEINPDAVIYIEDIIPVTYSKSISDATYNNDRIAVFNQLISELCVEEEVYFLKVSDALVDDSGCLPEEASSDGVHMYPSYYEKWISYIKCHTIGEHS